MRSFLIGFFSGLLLSALRAPLGLELLQVPATTSGASAAYRAAALLVIGIGLVLGMRRASAKLSPALWLTGTFLGYQVHWQFAASPPQTAVELIFSLLLVTLLVAGHRGNPDSRPKRLRIILLGVAAIGGWLLISGGYAKSHVGAVGAALVGLISIAIVGRQTDNEELSEEDSSKEGGSLPAGGVTSLAICGAGLAILSQGISRSLRLLGGGHLEDDSVFGSVFLALAAFGAISFARNIKSKSSVILARCCVAATSGLAAWAGFRVLANLASNRGLDLYTRSFTRFGQNWDLSIHGQTHYDLIVAAPILVVAAFFCGTFIGLSRKPIELAAVLIGAAAGLVLSPSLLKFDWSASADLISSSHSSEMALFGGLVAAGGALLMAISSSGLNRNQRLIGCVVAFGGIAMCRFPEQGYISILDPWVKREVQPLWELDAPVGLITIELDELDEPYATLDRKAITPMREMEVEDRLQIIQSFALLGTEPREKKPRVLYVGQLTMSRALLMSDLGVSGIDRTASWNTAMPALEQKLFGSTPKWFPGEILTMPEARLALDRGEYDLVIVPPIAGDAPTTRNLASPKETTVVVWLDAANGVETQHLGEFVLASVPGLTKMFIAVAHGPQVDAVRSEKSFGSIAFIETGEPTSGMPALEFLGTPESSRRDMLQARLAGRFAEVERSPGIAAGLATHFGSQVPSSPFESAESKVELIPDALRRFSEAGLAAHPSSLVVQALETCGFLLGEQRKVEEIYEYLAQPAERHAPWPGLEVALAQASMEFLEPEAALESLKRAHEVWAGSPPSWAMQADAEMQAGDDSAAVQSLEKALALAPHNHEIERRLAIAYCRAADPRAKSALQDALVEDPEDSELLRYQEGGPYSAPQAGFRKLMQHEH
ncbi:MAG: hypothetical protein ACI8X5_004117 [Planctomycetota bacterium]|jgi:hypothetical protein